MRKNKVNIVFLILFIFLNYKALLVHSPIITNFDYVESFEFQMPAFHKETIIFSEHVNLTLFDISDHSLTFVYYTVELSDIFYINNVELLRLSQKIQYIDEILLNSTVRLTFKSSFSIGGNIYFNQSAMPIVTNKELYNPNNYSISILLDVEIIHNYTLIEDPSLSLIIFYLFEIIGFILVLILIGIRKLRK